MISALDVFIFISQSCTRRVTAQTRLGLRPHTPSTFQHDEIKWVFPSKLCPLVNDASVLYNKENIRRTKTPNHLGSLYNIRYFFQVRCVLFKRFKYETVQTHKSKHW